MKNPLHALLLPLLMASTATHADAPGEPRLIQTSETERSWMTEEQVSELSRRSHEAGHCGGFMDVTEHPDKAPVFNRILGIFETRTLQQGELVHRLLPELSSANVAATVRHLSGFHNRYYTSQTGVAAAHWIRDQFARLAQNRTDVTVELFKHRFAQPSVIARVAGKGARAAERVVIGAHEDSINWSNGWASPTDKAPGADDDASGVATVLEIFRVLMESGYRPDRTIEFITYAGEEKGLLGSQDIAEKYKKDGVKVVGALQFDMTAFPGRMPKLRLISDHTDPELTRFTATLIDEYVKVPWVEMRCGYGCSDHASWTEAGYPSAFPFESSMNDSNPHIHTPKDTAAILDWDFGLHFAQLGVAYAVELATE